MVPRQASSLTRIRAWEELEKDPTAGLGSQLWRGLWEWPRCGAQKGTWDVREEAGGGCGGWVVRPEHYRAWNNSRRSLKLALYPEGIWAWAGWSVPPTAMTCPFPHLSQGLGSAQTQTKQWILCVARSPLILLSRY